MNDINNSTIQKNKIIRKVPTQHVNQSKKTKILVHKYMHTSIQWTID
nr:MAG TPA: hypothetical protein [Bacteriophage sp.]